MDLIDDIHFVLTNARWDPDLLIERPDIFNRIVRGSVQLEDIERIIVVLILDGILVDLTSQDSGARRFTNSTGTAEQECLSEMIIPDLVIQSLGHMTLSDHLFKGGWSVFSGRNDVFAHRHKKSKNLNGNGTC